MSFEVKVKRLSHRDWSELASAWLPHIAQLSFPQPGQRPDEPLSALYSLQEISVRVPPDGEIRAEIQGLRSALLHEGIFLLHKAANVLVVSQDQVLGGTPTWSVATAYQSAFFSMEAMLMLLGVAVVEVNDRTLQIDVWPTVESAASRKAKASYRLGLEAQYVRHKRIDHHHRWAILKRILRTLENSPIRGEVLNAIESIDDKHFARQRNKLHYSNGWTFDDLHTYFSPLSYCRFQAEPPLLARLDSENEDFTVVLATVLFSSAASLLASLGSLAPVIQNEVSMLNAACSGDRMKLRRDYEYAMNNVSMV